MVIKVKCCKCNNTLNLYVSDENRKRATNAKKFILGKFSCKMINSKCKYNEE